MTTYRYLWQPAPDDVRGGWCYFNAALNTAEGAAVLVEHWNRRDAGKRRWRCELVDVLDIDHPCAERRYALRARRCRLSRKTNPRGLRG